MKCNCCNKFIKSTAVAISGSNLLVTLPSGSLETGDWRCCVVCQQIPTAGLGLQVKYTDGTATGYCLDDVGDIVIGCQLKCRKKYRTYLNTAGNLYFRNIVPFNNCCDDLPVTV